MARKAGYTGGQSDNHERPAEVSENSSRSSDSEANNDPEVDRSDQVPEVDPTSRRVERRGGGNSDAPAPKRARSGSHRVRTGGSNSVPIENRSEQEDEEGDNGEVDNEEGDNEEGDNEEGDNEEVDNEEADDEEEDDEEVGNEEGDDEEEDDEEVDNEERDDEEEEDNEVEDNGEEDDDGEDNEEEENEEDKNIEEIYERHGRIYVPPPPAGSANTHRRDTIPDENQEEPVAFCCRECKCSQQRKNSIVNFAEYPFVQVAEDSLSHWRCCHKLIEEELSEFWMTDFDQARVDFERNYFGNALVPAGVVPTEIDHAMLTRLKREARSKEKLLRSSYSNFENALQNSPERTKEFNSIPRVDHAAVVWDLSGGIGGGIVSLKRCGIAISSIVHLEQDRIATHVYKWNHDPEYLSERSGEGGEASGGNHKPCIDDDISHFYVRLQKGAKELNVADMIKRYGNVDIILATPIVMDYDDPESSKEHLSLVRKTIREVKKIHNNHHVFALVEIAAIMEDEFVHLDVESKEKVQNQLAVPGCFEFDAALFSPMSRKSTLFTNIAITGSMVSPSDVFPLTGGASANRCLRAEPKIDRDGLQPMEEPAQQLFEHCGDDAMSRFHGFSPKWANIDNKNTWVFCKNRSGRSILKRPLRVQERESCMGYPDDYVHGPANDIFCSLIQDGYEKTLLTEPYWRDTLPKEYHSFGGHDVKFDASVKPISLLLPYPGLERHVNEHEYACHLIASSSPIPVLDKVLCELRAKFPTVEYTGYPYQYRWNEKVEGEATD